MEQPVDRDDSYTLDTPTDFANTLRRFMDRSYRSAHDLERLSGVPARTIENWCQGRVRQPREISDLLKLARALALDSTDATSLLESAHWPSLTTVWEQAQRAEDTARLNLLALWTIELDTQYVPTHPVPNDLQPSLAATLLPPSALHQLRAPIGDFVGRTDEINQLTAALRRATTMGGIAAIGGVQGMGGIGKTELAYKVAQEVRYTFPNAQIVLNLQGTSSTPLPPKQALQTVIHAFTPDAKLPDDLPTLETLYRTQLDTKRVLILADDAASAAQVQVLLPPAGSALLVTSRVRFTMPAMTTIDLNQLPPVEASQLLHTICPRLTADQAATIAHTCGYLPLALRISGGLLHNTSALAVTDYLAQLTDERQRLNHLRDPDHPQHDIEATLTLSYAQLTSAAQAVFRQLGVFVADFGTELAQIVVIMPEGGNITAILHHLLRRNLVLYDVEHARWRLHDLVRDLARQRLEELGEIEASQWRYARAVLQIAQDIQNHYQAGGEKLLLALSQFDVERAHIDAARRWAQHHTQIPEGDQLLLDVALATRYIQELRFDSRSEIIPLWEGVQMAAKRLGDGYGEWVALNNLGLAYHRLGELHTAITYHEQALTIARELGNHRNEGITLNNLACACYSLGELHMAITYHEQALANARELGNRHSEGIALSNLGNTYADLGEPSRAISYYEQALAINHDIGDSQGKSYTLTNLGNAYTKLGDTHRAIDACEEALTITRAIGDRQLEGDALIYLARAQATQGDIVQATTTFAQALALLQEVNDRWAAAECQWYFGLALAQNGKRECALPLLHAALAYEQEIGHAKAEEHAALITRMEAGEELSPELHVPTDQRAWACSYESGSSASSVNRVGR